MRSGVEQPEVDGTAVESGGRTRLLGPDRPEGSDDVHDQVTIHMDATPAQVWALVSDVTQIGRFSPETVAAEWLDGATGPAVGARFRGQVKRNGRGPKYWTLCTVTECEPERRFAFKVGTKRLAVNNWGYELAPAEGGGTDVTEFFRLEDILPLRIYWGLLGKLRGKTNAEGMRQTLERIKAVVEADAAA